MLLRTLLVSLFVLARFAAAQLEVVVVDELQKPVSGARVTSVDAPTPAHATSDADGRATLATQVSTASPHLRVEADGFFHVDAEWPPQSPLTITLRHAVALRGHVTFADGAAAGGVEVRLLHSACKSCAPDVVQADEHGDFEFARVPRQVDLELQIGGSEVAFQRVALGALNEAQRAERTLQIDRGLLVRGRVIDFESNAVIAGARIASVPGKLNHATSGADGRFELHIVPESFRQLARFEVSADGYCELGVVLDAGEVAPQRELCCPLPRFAALTGVVLDTNGAPAAGAEVFLREDPQWLTVRRTRGQRTPIIPLDDLPSRWTVSSGEANASTRTDEHGRFRFDHVCPWMTNFLVHSQHPTAGGAQLSVAVGAAAGEVLEVTLRPPQNLPSAKVSGHVTVNGIAAQGVIAWKGDTRSGKIGVDSHGAFSSDEVEPGVVHIAIETLFSPTIQFGRVFASESALLQLEEHGAVEQDFALVCELATIAGRVTDARGTPRPKLSVAVKDATRGVMGQGQTDADGRFQLEVPAGHTEWHALVISGPQIFERDGLREGARDVELVVAELGRAKVRFVDAQTRANLAPALLLWRMRGASGLEKRAPALLAVRDEPGWFEIELPVGELELGAWVARASYPPSAPRAVTIRADQVAKVEFALAEGSPLAFEWAGDSQRPPSDESGRVWVLEEEWWSESKASDESARGSVALPTLAERFRLLKFDDSGKAQVPGLRPGRYRFVTASRSDRIEPEAFEFTGASEAPLRLRWSRRN